MRALAVKSLLDNLDGRRTGRSEWYTAGCGTALIVPSIYVNRGALPTADADV